MIVVREVLAQEQESGQVELSPLDHAESDGKASDQTRAGDAAACFVVAHPQSSLAEVKERGACGLEIEPPLLDFAEEGEQTARTWRPWPMSVCSPESN